MHLVAPLLGGIRGAENGTVSFVLRGTTTPASYYADFEGTQLLPGTGVQLDSFGALEAYVSALVTVRVYDTLGVLVREFVAGAADASVEVISPSFTGVDYTSGATGVQKPTNVENVLDAWVTSAGSPDWKVRVSGSDVPLQVAVGLAAATFFNVKSYGAQGNGTSDDGAAIVATIAAATAAGGGTVFFPPGIYRITAPITLASNINLLGSGGLASKLAIDSAAGAGAIVLGANGVGAIAGAAKLWVGAINGAVPGVLIEGGGGATGEFHFVDCVLGNDALCNSNLYANLTSLTTFKAVFERCYTRVSLGSARMFDHRGAGRLTVRDCDLISNQGFPGDFIRCDDGGLIEGNRFDGTAATLGTFNYVSIAPATYGLVTIIGNQFAPNVTVTPTAIYNSLAVPNRDCMEHSNVFGDVATGPFGCIPYAYATDGYAAIVSTLPTSGHGSRAARTEGFPGHAVAAVTVDPKAFGTTVVARTGGANLTVNANRGSPGDRWVLHVSNTSGAPITVIGGTNVIFDPVVAPLPVTNNGFAEVHLAWLPNAAGTGFWYQTAKAVLS